jgi:glycolate oxidase
MPGSAEGSAGRAAAPLTPSGVVEPAGAPPAAAVAVLAVASGRATSAAGRLALLDASLSSSLGLRLGALSASSCGASGVALAGGSGGGSGSVSWRSLQPSESAEAKHSATRASVRLSIFQTKSQLRTRVKRESRVSANLEAVLLSRPDLPRPSLSAREKAKSLLEQRLGPSKVLTGRDACERFTRDESEAEGEVPDAVVLATSTDDILAALAVAREAEVPITPRAGGTGRTGGAVPMAGGIVLATSGMNKIIEIDRKDGIAVVEPGVVLADLHAAVEAEGWFYPPDPNSLKNCAIGGNVAENAGGPRAFKYGVTRDYVLGVEALLLGGQRIQAGRRTIKGVTGYDVTGLLVGSEGTLAVFGQATLQLIPKPPSVMTLLTLFSNVNQAGDAVQAIIGAGISPRCIELLDASTLEAMRLAGNSINPAAGAMLLIEVDGDEASVERQAERVSGACEDVNALEVLVAQDEAQRERLWSARREMSHAVRKLTKKKLSEDVVVPRKSIGALLDFVREVSERTGVRTLTYGHAGDGNLHVNFLWNEEHEVPAVERAILELFQRVIALGGTLSGEHGIGVLKAAYLPLEQSAELIALQKDLKRVFDPAGLLNPGKIFPDAVHRAC